MPNGRLKHMFFKGMGANCPKKGALDCRGPKGLLAITSQGCHHEGTVAIHMPDTSAAKAHVDCRVETKFLLAMTILGPTASFGSSSRTTMGRVATTLFCFTLRFFALSPTRRTFPTIRKFSKFLNKINQLNGFLQNGCG